MKTKRISADEAIAKAKANEQTRETSAGITLVKAAKAPPSWDKNERSARFVMTSQAQDRYGDIVVTDGVDLSEFEQNPVGLLFHNSRTWPVGHWANMEKMLRGRPPRLEGDLIMLPAGGPVKEVDEAAWMIENGGIRACSIGFLPDWDEVESVLDDEGKWMGMRFVRSTLLECSICAIPANPQALAKSFGEDHRLARELIEDILDNWARTPEGVMVPRKAYEEAYSVVKAGDGVVRKDGGITVGGLQVFVRNAGAEEYAFVAEAARKAVEEALAEYTVPKAKDADEGVGLRAAEPDMEPEEEGCKPKKDGGCGDEDEPETATEAAEEAMPEDEKKHVGGLVEGFVKSLSAFFKRKQVDPSDITAESVSATKIQAEASAPEPEQKAAEPAPPTPEEIHETIEAAAAVRARLIASGLIKAA